jgi:hypothetical protein
MLGINNVTLQETRFYQEVKAEGMQEGRQKGLQEGEELGRLGAKRDLLQLIITQKFGTPAKRITQAIALLPTAQLDQLAIALLPFSERSDLETWLKTTLRETLHNQLADKFLATSLPPNLPTILQTQTLSQLIHLGQDLPDLRTLQDLIDWLE